MTNYQESNLKTEIIEAVTELGFVEPTPIQAECIPFLLSSQDDLIANAQTGTGKTAAFGLPIIQQLDSNNDSIQALILSPTRELAIQICKDMEKFAAKLPAVKIIPVYGGASAEPQIMALRKSVQVVVGTPGRVLDLINRKKLKVNNIKWLVLDEADEMLNMGFKDELDGILETTPASRQTLLFSATLPPGILKISKNYMNNPQQIAVAKANSGTENVEHHYYQVSARDKYAALKRLADFYPNIYAIVFCRTRMETKDIADKLIKDGYNADALHGDLSQAQREFVMNRFRCRNLQILVATDVAARGLDVNELTHVINYTLPDDPEVYVHRSGRTGRAGKKGICISIAHHRENRKIKENQKFIGRKFEQKLVPGGREICEKQLFKLIGNMESVDLSSGEMDSFMDVIYSKLDSLSKEEVIKRFVAVEFNRFLEYYKNAKDLNVSGGSDKSDRKDKRKDSQESPKRQRSSSSNMKRFHLSVGSKNHANPASIIGLINKATPGLSVEVGHIEILKKFSFFEVDSKYAYEVLDGMNGLSHRGEAVVVEFSESPKPMEGDSGKGRKGQSKGDDRNSRGGKKFSRGHKDSKSKSRSSKPTSKQRKTGKQW